MSSDERGDRRHRHGGHFLIPAGILIGLGVGLLAGYVASGVLIGLGCGFVLSAFAGRSAETPGPDSSQSGSPREQGNSCCGSYPCRPGNCSSRWPMVIVGIFIILVGIGITWAPPDFWKYIIAGFLILFGAWFVYREYSRNH